MSDWADDLASEIVQDILDSGKPKLLIAARLRVVHQRGVGEGIEQCRQAFNEIFNKGEAKVDA